MNDELDEIVAERERDIARLREVYGFSECEAIDFLDNYQIRKEGAVLCHK